MDSVIINLPNYGLYENSINPHLFANDLEYDKKGKYIYPGESEFFRKLYRV